MDSKDIEAQLKSLIGLNLSQNATGTLPISKDSGTSRAPGAYPHGGGRGGAGGSGQANRKPDQRDKKSSVAKKKGNKSELSGAGGEANTRDREMLARLQEEARMEAAHNKQSRDTEFRPSEEVARFLAARHMFPLSQRSAKFPRAKWFCRLTEYHCDNLATCLDHITEPRYLRMLRNREMDETLVGLPRPSRNHLDCLAAVLANIEREKGLAHSDISSRQAVASVVHNLLQQHLPGCSVRLYGSSWSGFGLKTANVNLDLQITPDHKPHLALLKALEVLSSCQEFHSVTDEFTLKIPTIKFSTHSNMACELSLNNVQPFQTSSLLRDYWHLDSRVRTLGVALRYWASLVRLDRQAEGSLPPHSFAILLVHFLQQLPQPVLPCIHDWLDDDAGQTYVSPIEKLKSWKTQNKQSVPELWVELFEFLSVKFKSAELVVSIRKGGATTNEEKQWKSKKLAIEDPFSCKRSLCRSIQSLSVYDYITSCFKTSFLYFGTIQTSLGPVITRIVPQSSDLQGPIPISDWTLESWLAKKGTEVTQQEAETATELVPRNMVAFTFDQEILTAGTVLAPQCVMCGKEGHLVASCPEEQLPVLPELAPVPAPYLKMLSAVCEEVTRDWEPHFQELRDRERIHNDLSRFIKKFWPKAELTLFGSSSNGFAFRHSDLDISLTFRDVADVSELDCIAIIEELSERIKAMAGVKNVIAITSAKVPIVKMFHTKARLDADISLYNVLARENTRLLSLYAELDTRCRTLGYMVKLFAKVCDIGDASRGSLSSYAYILMMIFYLQKVSPPVLPVLQELYPPGQDKPENLVDGWNAWFCSDKKMISAWDGWGKNRWSVGDLWIGFLDFFARAWDDKRLVVSIKQSQNLTKFEKMWISPCIAIEDPFELSHNLGAGISRKMNLYIKKAFINARSVFGRPIRHRPPNYHTIQDYFFDRQLLTDGAPPNDRGCRACGKIGHIVAECPRSRQKKTAENRKREQEKEKPREPERPREPEKQPSEGKQIDSTQDANANEKIKEVEGSIGSDFKDGNQKQLNQLGPPQNLQLQSSPEHVLHPQQQLPPNLQQLHQQMLLEQQLQRQSPQQLQQQLYQQHLLEQVRHQQHLLGQLHQQQALIHAQQQKQLQQQMREEKMKSEAQEGSPGFDLSAFAGLAVGKPMDMRGAITAEDLEASFHTDTDVSTDEGTEARPPGLPQPQRRPPGFDRGPMARPGDQGAPPPLPGDVLGVQSLANLAAQPPSSPLPMFGGPLLFPPRFPGLSPFLPGGPGLLPGHGPGHPPGGPMWPPGPGLMPGQGQAPMHNPEMQSPWLNFLDPRFPVNQSNSTSNPLPIPSARSVPQSPEPLLDEGSPITPPNLQSFNFGR